MNPTSRLPAPMKVLPPPGAALEAGQAPPAYVAPSADNQPPNDVPAEDPVAPPSYRQELDDEIMEVKKTLVAFQHIRGVMEARLFMNDTPEAATQAKKEAQGHMRSAFKGSTPHDLLLLAKNRLSPLAQKIVDMEELLWQMNKSLGCPSDKLVELEANRAHQFPASVPVPYAIWDMTGAPEIRQEPPLTPVVMHAQPDALPKTLFEQFNLDDARARPVAREGLVKFFAERLGARPCTEENFKWTVIGELKGYQNLHAEIRDLGDAFGRLTPQERMNTSIVAQVSAMQADRIGRKAQEMQAPQAEVKSGPPLVQVQPRKAAAAVKPKKVKPLQAVRTTETNLPRDVKRALVNFLMPQLKGKDSVGDKFWNSVAFLPDFQKLPDDAKALARSIAALEPAERADTEIVAALVTLQAFPMVKPEPARNLQHAQVSAAGPAASVAPQADEKRPGLLKPGESAQAVRKADLSTVRESRLQAMRRSIRALQKAELSVTRGYLEQSTAQLKAAGAKLSPTDAKSLGDFMSLVKSSGNELMVEAVPGFAALPPAVQHIARRSEEVSAFRYTSQTLEKGIPQLEQSPDFDRISEPIGADDLVKLKKKLVEHEQSVADFEEQMKPNVIARRAWHAQIPEPELDTIRGIFAKVADVSNEGVLERVMREPAVKELSEAAVRVLELDGLMDDQHRLNEAKKEWITATKDFIEASELRPGSGEQGEAAADRLPAAIKTQREVVNKISALAGAAHSALTPAAQKAAVKFMDEVRTSGRGWHHMEAESGFKALSPEVRASLQRRAQEVMERRTLAEMVDAPFRDRLKKLEAEALAHPLLSSPLTDEAVEIEKTMPLSEYRAAFSMVEQAEAAGNGSVLDRVRLHAGFKGLNVAQKRWAELDATLRDMGKLNLARKREIADLRIRLEAKDD